MAISFLSFSDKFLKYNCRKQSIEMAPLDKSEETSFHFQIYPRYQKMNLEFATDTWKQNRKCSFRQEKRNVYTRRRRSFRQEKRQAYTRTRSQFLAQRRRMQSKGSPSTSFQTSRTRQWVTHWIWIKFNTTPNLSIWHVLSTCWFYSFAWSC